MIEAIVSDSMTDTCDDRPAHHMMTNEDRAQRRVCQDHFFGASNDNHEDAVHPKRDMHAEKTAEILNENDTVRPKCDLIMMKVNVTANEEFELRHKCDEDAAKSVVHENTNVAAASRQEKNANGKAAVKNISEENDEVTSEDGTITRLVDEGRSIARGEKQHLKEVCKHISKVYQRQKRTDIQETIHRIFEEFRSIKKHILHRISEEKNANSKSYKWKKVTQLHREKELQMSSANSAVIYLQTMELKESHTTLLNHETFTEDNEKKNDEKKLKTYLWLLMKRFRQPWTNSNKERRDNNGIRAEDIKTCDDATKANIKPSSTRCYLKQSRNVADSTIKSYLQKGNEEYVGS